jgi:NADH:ubiquinone oxidoreductase subunit 6 (subunit J)
VLEVGCGTGQATRSLAALGYPVTAVEPGAAMAAYARRRLAGFGDVRVELDRVVVGSAEATGDTIFRSWVLPFEVLSVLLLAALVGAIVLSRLRAAENGGE